MTATGGYAQIITGWSWRGLEALILANDQLRVVMLPQLGGRIWEITHQASGRQLLWHNPRMPAAPVAFGAGYDDNFLGGWDELFPNDLPEELAGEPYPDHGEVWSVPWSWEVLPGPDAAVRLSVTTRISGCALTRIVRLAPASAAIEVELSITNGSGGALPMLHKQHLAVDLPPGSRIDLPAGMVEIGDFGRPRAGSAGDRFAWPVGAGVDFSASPEADGSVSELLFASDLADGWCACTDPSGVGIGLVFDRRTYPSVWTFASWGGWRNHRVAVLEPCTGVGLSVTEGLAVGRHRSLAPGETITTTLSAVVYAGLQKVLRISGHGANAVAEGRPR
ncbi:MAG: hypothetical protein ACOH1Y_02250 [Propionicimonas sp.]